ncbi:MAG: MtrB/PioB family outer membrane beta-barrel protein [Elusimicrobia bacterium]|nr:MtrB/PioB family outer membrane beta-barrel protein [Elusimicrobiota bacterium]
MKKYLSLFLASTMSLAGFPAWAEVSHEIDMKVQNRSQKTFLGAKSATPEEYGEIPNGFILERYLVEFDKENYLFDFEATNVGLNNQSLRTEGGKPGSMMWKAGYDMMPHLFSYEARSPFTHVGEGTMGLQGAWRNTALTSHNNSFNAGVSTALANAPYVPLGFDVETANLDLKFHPAKDFTMELGSMRQTKRGTKAQPAAFGFSNAIELAAPIDWVTNEAYLDMQLAKKEYQLAFNYRLSDFNNKIANLFWDNPKRLTDQYINSSHYSAGDGTSKGQLSNAPDNQAHALKLEGGVALPMNSRFSFEGGYQRWTANNDMMTYTGNSQMWQGNATAAAAGLTFAAFDPANRPSATVDGRIDVYTYLFRLTSRPLSWLKGTLSHDAYIMENKSSQYNLPGWAVFDNVWHSENATTPREQFREDKTSLKVDYEVTSWLSGDVGVSHKYEKKTREIPKGKTDEATLGFQFRPVKNLFVNLSGLFSARRGNGMDLQHYPTTVSAATGRRYFTESPGLRRIDVADRNRTVARAQVQWTPGEASVGLSARLSEDKYRLGKGDPTGGDVFVYSEHMGMTSDINRSMGVDFAVPVIGSIEVDGYYTFDMNSRYLKSSQTACAGQVANGTGYGLPGEPVSGTNTCAATSATIMLNDPRSRWETRVNDRSHIAGFSVTARPIAKLKTVVGYDISSTIQNLDTMYAGSFASTAADPYNSFPASRRMLQTARARGEYKLTENLTVAANYQFEKFDATDFAYGNVPLRDASNASIFLGVNPIRNYVAHTIGTGVNYKF